MNKYWVQRAKLTRETTIRLMQLLDCRSLLAQLTLRTVNLNDPDLITENFGDIMTGLIDKVDLKEGAYLNKAREDTKEHLKEDGALEAHCDNCKNDPKRPVDYWDHVAFIEEKSMEAVGHLVITGADDGRDSLLMMKTIGILGQWDHSLRKLNESFKPAPKNATVH